MRSFLTHTWAVLYRELGRMVRFRIPLVLLFVLPLLSFVCFALIFRNSISSMPIAVLDEDRTPLSRTLVSMVGDTPTVLVAYEIQDMEEGMRLMRQGKIHAILQIPSAFEKDILGGRQTHAEFYDSGANISVNGLLARDVQTAVTTFSTGVQLQMLEAKGLTERQAMAQARPVAFDKHILFNPFVNYAYYLAPSMLVMMLLIFTVLSTVYAVGSELKYATARQWLETAGGSVAAAVTGKMLPVTAVMSAMMMAMYGVVFVVVGAPLNGSIVMLMAGAVVFVLSYQAIGLFVAAMSANLRLALSFGGGYSVLAFTFSGLTFPTMAMYGAMRVFSLLFPFTFYMQMYVDIAMRGARWTYALQDLGCMLAFQLLPVLVLPRLKRICMDSRYWGRL